MALNNFLCKEYPRNLKDKIISMLLRKCPEHVGFKTGCFVLSLWLLAGEFLTVFVEKPSEISIKMTTMDETIFPAISVCLIDGVDVNLMEENGYHYSYDYLTGKFVGIYRTFEDSPFFGWSGINSAEPMELMNNTILVKIKSSIIV